MSRTSLRHALLTLHVATSVALLGTTAGLLVAAVHAARLDDARDARAVYELLPSLVFSLGIPLSLLSLVSGVALGLTSRWGVFRHAWVTAKLVALLLTVLTGALLNGPAIDELADATARGETGSSTAWRLVATTGTQVVLVLGSTALSVFKPRRRGGSRAARPAARRPTRTAA
jgi:hypothetical protein